MNSSVKKRLILYFFLVAVIGLILLTTPISYPGENEAKNKEDNLAISNPAYVYKDVYTVCKVFTKEYKVAETDAAGCYNMGNGVFHIRGESCGWSPFKTVTSTTRARLDFGFNNPYRDTSSSLDSGPPVSYTVSCSIRYRNWNDYDGYVILYVLHDLGVWVPIWVKSGLDHVDQTWSVSWDPGIFASWYYRDDGSMDFRLVGESKTKSFGQKPSCKVNINDLKVTLKYDSDKIRPVGDVYVVGKKYTSERDVDKVLSKSLNNIGDGVFHIRGYVALFGPQTTRARLDFGFNNPVYTEAGLPARCTVKFSLRYKNWNDDSGYVKLYAKHDDGTWDVIWQKTGLDQVIRTWEGQSVSISSSAYCRSDGSMEFKIVGESYESTWLDRPSVQVNVWDLRVSLDYKPHADAGGPYTEFEGVPVTLDASSSYDVTGDKLYYRWDFDNNGVWDTGWKSSPTISHTWKDDYYGYVRVEVKDKSSGSYYSDIDTARVTIGNVAPIVDAGPDREDYEGWVIISNGFYDPGVDDTHTIEYDYGDGSPLSDEKIHRYADDGLYTVTWTVEDDDGGVGIDTFELLIHNVAPTVDAGPDQIVATEGVPVYFNGIFSDPGTADTHTIEWDFGDGDTSTGFLTPGHIYYNNGTYTVILTVTDDDGGVGTDTLEVKVGNIAPEVDIGPDKEVDEGEIVSFSGTITDPGDFYWTILWNFGDGTTATESLTPTHAYGDNGVYPVTLTVIDDDGNIGSDTLIVTVNNLAPMTDAGPDQTVDEGDTVSFFGNPNDPGWLDTHTYEWDFGDLSIGTGPNPTHNYVDNGVYTVTLTVTDDDGSASSDTLTVNVNNVAPIVDAGPDQTVDEGDVVFISDDFYDPGLLDTHTYEWDFGDGSPTVTETLTTTHKYGDNGVYTVTLTVTDNDDGVGFDTLTVTVNNVAPIIDAGSDQEADEGDTISFDGIIDDPGIDDTHIIEWDFGDGTTATETLTPTHVYGDNGTYEVSLTVTDDDGAVSLDTLTVTINNVAPTADAGPDQTADEGATVSFSGGVTDPGWLDTHTYEWDFGDLSTETGSNPTHAYGDNGVYTVTLTVTDDDGDIGTDTMTVTVENVAPGVAVTYGGSNNEGGMVWYVGGIDDWGWLDTHTWEWDFGDGTTATETLIPTHVYGDNGVYTVTLTVTDDDGGVGIATFTLVINNVAPTAYAGSDQTVDEGEIVSFSGSATDPGWLDTHTYKWDFGDLTTGTGKNPTHVYEIPGTYLVSLTVTDDDGGSHTDWLVVTVLDITPPITTLTILPPYQGTTEPFYVSTDTEFVLSAHDGDGFGVAMIYYQIDNVAFPPHAGDLLSFFIPDIGLHTIYYYSIDVVGNVEVEKSLQVIVNASELTYTGELSGEYSDPVLLEAILIDKATLLPIPGKTIEFTVNSQIVHAITDINGVASYTLILDQPSGSYSVSASFAGDTDYLASSDIHAFTLEKEHVYATYTGNSVVPTTVDTITLRATVFDEDDGNWGDLTKIYVTFTIYDENYLILEIHSQWVSTTNVDGVGVAIKDILRNLDEGGYIVKVSFDPNVNAYYQGPDSDFVVFIIYKPTGDFVTGGGWIEDTEGNKGNFGFNVKYKKNNIQGKAIYVYRDGDFVYIVKSNAWIGMAIDKETNHSFFEAKCNVKKIDPNTGQIVWEEGGYIFRIDVWDHSKDGKEDVFQIRVYDKNGLVYHDAGFNPYGILQGGNIVIHVDDPK